MCAALFVGSYGPIRRCNASDKIRPCPSITTIQVAPLPATANIFLVGLMGAGKTSVGRMLAQTHEQGIPMTPTPKSKKSPASRSPSFLKLKVNPDSGHAKRKVIDQLTAMNGIVLATGGGAVISAGKPHATEESRPGNLSARRSGGSLAAHASRSQPSFAADGGPTGETAHPARTARSALS